MFEKIFGNDEVKKILYNDINSNKIVSSYIFEGKDSDYLVSLAMEFAGLLLKSKTPEKKADFALYGRTDKIKKEDAQSIAKDVYIRPFELDRKVYLLLEAEGIQVESQNVLLKTLEEAPSYVVIILVTKSLNMILDTIISRSKVIRVNPLSKSELISYIELNYPKLINKELYASIAIGEISTLKSFIEDDNEMHLRKQSINIVIDILKSKYYESIKNLEFLEENKDDIEKILTYFEIFIKDIVSSESRIINLDYKDEIKSLKGLSIYDLVDSINMIEETKRYLANSGNFRLHLETLVLNMLEKFDRWFNE